MKPDSNLAGTNMIQNIANEAANARATAFASRLDNLISSTGQAARRNPVLTAVGETVATGGAGATRAASRGAIKGALAMTAPCKLAQGSLFLQDLLARQGLPHVLATVIPATAYALSRIHI